MLYRSAVSATAVADKLRLAVAIVIAFAVGAPARALAQPGDSQSSSTSTSTSTSTKDRQRVDRLAAYWAAELAARCPVAQPQDQAAFAACRQALYGHAGLKKQLPEFLLWGRQKDPAPLLRDSTLTQFAPDVWMHLYLPLFMFNGKYTVEHVAKEGLFLVRLEAAFRNRLAPGQFPYPFWHNEEKWSFYQNARSMLLWVDPRTPAVAAVQYTPRGKNPPLIASEPVAHRFDGKWMWTDASGRLQPQVTLFDGLFSDQNPHKRQLDAAYRDLANKMRAGQCSSCHVPDNPFKMKKLVLLQTPAHASGEIQRILDDVRLNRMPLDRSGRAVPLDPAVKKALLESGARFASAVDAAKKWEQRNRSQNGNSESR